MADLYNLTNVTSSNNLLEITQQVNQLSGEIFGLMFLISFFIILFVSFRGEDVSVKFTSAAFLTTILAILFRVIDLTGDRIVLIIVLITAVGYIIMNYSNG